MRFLTYITIVVLAIVLSGCGSAQSDDYYAQQPKLKAIIDNQPAPDLNGHSFERGVVIAMYLARNQNVSTHTYTLTIEGKIIKICDSIGFPIPYATQITPPYVPYGGNGSTMPNPEPNSLYSPDNAEGSYVACVAEDGTLAPSYWEPRVFALPYEIHADIVLSPTSNSSIKIQK